MQVRTGARARSRLAQAEDQLLLVRLRDPASGMEAFYPPGGGIDEGESPADAARRETLEETGLHVVVDPASELVARYPFVWNATAYDVTTHFFHATTSERDLPPVVTSALRDQSRSRTSFRTEVRLRREQVARPIALSSQ